MFEEDDPPEEIVTLRKKLLRYTKSLNVIEKDKYDDVLYYIQLKED